MKAEIGPLVPPAGTTDPTPGNNTASDTDSVTPVADLAAAVGSDEERLGKVIVRITIGSADGSHISIHEAPSPLEEARRNTAAGSRALEQGLYSEAERFLQTAFATHPDSGAERYQLALARTGVKARTHFLRAVELDPDFASAYNALSAVYGNLGEWERSHAFARLAFDRRERVSSPLRRRSSARVSVMDCCARVIPT